MKISGIICEYNPMHSGHVYHINETRANGATHIVCAMSGNYVQRGEPAFVDKWTRAKVAVNNGADLVVEIPTPWCLESAEKYAIGGVSVLNFCNCQSISCGVESDSTNIIDSLLSVFDSESFVNNIKLELKNGVTYPVAITNTCKKFDIEGGEQFFSKPNNVLAFEYARAIKNINSSISLEYVRRFGNEYNDNKVTGEYISASAIRNANGDVDEKYYATSMIDEINKAKEEFRFPVSTDSGSLAIMSTLSQMDKDELYKYCSVDTANKIYEALKSSENVAELYSKVKNKSVTLSSVRRDIMRCFLKIPRDISNYPVPYLKVLAIGDKGKEILNSIDSDISIISSFSSIKKENEDVQQLYNLECNASTLYGCFSKKFVYQNYEKTKKLYVK